MKVKIIIAPYFYHPPKLRQFYHHKLIFPPYGAGCLANFLRKHGYMVSIEDLSLRTEEWRSYLIAFNNKRMLEKITDYLIWDRTHKKIDFFTEKMFQYIWDKRYDLIGFSVLSRLTLPHSLLLAKKIKKRTGAIIIFGGPLITEYAELRRLKKIEEFFKKFTFIDYLIFGEGEEPLIKLLEYMRGIRKIADVSNLAYKDKDTVIINERKLFDIENMPPPDFDGLPLETYRQTQVKRSLVAKDNSLLLPYQITRGCIGKCSFCNFHLVHSYVEFKSHQKVIDELTQLKAKYNTNYFFFCDDRINCSYSYLEKLCNLIIENRLDIMWVSSVGITNVDKNLLMKMRKSGCYFLGWGIESGSDRILKMMNKGFSVSQAKKILQDSHEAGINNNVNLITGFIGERKEDVNQTITFIKENALYIDHVMIFDFGLFPKTSIADHPEAFGIENIHEDYHSPIGFGRLGYDERGGLKWKDIIKRKRKTYKRVQREVNKIFSRKYKQQVIIHK